MWINRNPKLLLGCCSLLFCANVFLLFHQRPQKKFVLTSKSHENDHVTPISDDNQVLQKSHGNHVAPMSHDSQMEPVLSIHPQKIEPLIGVEYGSDKAGNILSLNHSLYNNQNRKTNVNSPLLPASHHVPVEDIKQSIFARRSDYYKSSRTDVEEPHNVQSPVSPKLDYTELRKTYVVPNIQYTKLINCAKLLANDTAETEKAKRINRTVPKTPTYEETYEEWFKDCDMFKKDRGYVTIPLTQEEEDYPLAFSVAVYKDFEQMERLIRAIYQPQNLYCIHIDTKSPLLFHRITALYTKCFDNVFISHYLSKIKWGDVSVLLPATNCMKTLVEFHRRKWKYYINLTGQEFPLRTNYELVRIAKIFNGSNDIAGSLQRVEPGRVKYLWTHRWSKTYQQTIFYMTNKPAPPPPFNLTFFKGELHGLFSRKMVEYLVESDYGQKYLDWCWESGHPSEHYWNTLNYNPHVHAPGGYEGPLHLAHDYSYHPVVRAKHWQDMNYIPRECRGKVVRGICVYGIGDAAWLATRKELAANKFHMTFEYLTYDCLEERHRNRTKMKDKVPFDAEFYKKLPTVLYGRKDGL